MGSFPPYHIPRPRLTDACRDAAVVVVEAGTGYGKSVFAAELADAWHAVPIAVELVGAVSATSFAVRLQYAISRAGFREAARTLAAAGDDAQGRVDMALEALEVETCAFVLDDVHNAERDCAELIAYLASHLRGSERCAVLARRLPPGAERMLRAEYLQLSSVDLALRPEETLTLCREGFRLDSDPGDSAAIDAISGGWTAAAVLAVARATRSGEALRDVAAAAGRSVGVANPVVAILAEALGRLGAPERATVAQLARLPLVDAELATVASGDTTFFDRTMAIGIPWTPRTDGWWELPGPVQDHLATLAPPDAAVLELMASTYAVRGELSTALSLLVSHGYDASAAELLATADPARLYALDVSELSSFVERLPRAAVDSHPMVLVHLARHLMSATRMTEREAALQRVEAIAGERNDAELDRAVAAERAKDLVRDGEFDKADVAASAILIDVTEQEPLTRAGALSVLGRALCWKREDDGRVDVAALLEADRHLGAASQLYLELGVSAPAALLVPYRAIWVAWALGHSQAALRHLDEALGLVIDHPRTWAMLQIHRASVLPDLGRFEDQEAALKAATKIGEELEDDVLVAYAHWENLISASQRGDATDTLASIRITEQHAADWWPYASGEYYATSAEALGRIGETAMALEYLGRGLADPQDAAGPLEFTRAVLLARTGDPLEAETALLALPSAGVAPREYWRITLMRALAAWRRGDKGAGALAARAFEEAAALGLPQLPLIKERTVTEQLLGLAAETGRPAALALQTSALPVLVRVLGGFSVSSGGRELAVSPGQGTTLLKMLATCRGRVQREQAIDSLWPDTDISAGRKRLRTVLSRLRNEVGDVVVSHGETLVLSEGTDIDLALFEEDAKRALAAGSEEPTLALAWARSAIARYRGDVLPDDPYEEWTQALRESVRRTMLQLLDLCADSARVRGDLDELRRVLEMTIDFAPYEDDRYLRTASVLVEQGNRGAALTVLRRARSALAELGIEAPANLAALERQIVA